MLPFPNREQHRHRIGRQPARDKPERIDRCLVKPLRIIDQAQHRLFKRRLGDRDCNAAIQTRNRSGGGSATSPNANTNAFRWGSGSRASNPRNGTNS